VLFPLLVSQTFAKRWHAEQAAAAAASAAAPAAAGVQQQ
jgi:hypothetical protein